MANFWKTSGSLSSPERDTDDTVGPIAPVGPASPDLDELENDELELDDPVIDEAALPELDTEDADAGLHESGYEDLLDHRWLERADDDPGGDIGDDEGAPIDDIGLTIELDSARDDDDGAQVFDLDVGSLLTSLPAEGTELDLESGPERPDAALSVGALRDVLLPEEEDDDEHDDKDDKEVGDDERFPAFDDVAERPPRASDDDSEIGPDDLS